MRAGSLLLLAVLLAGCSSPPAPGNPVPPSDAPPGEMPADAGEPPGGTDAGAGENPCGLAAENADPPRLASRALDPDPRPPVGEPRVQPATGARVTRITDSDALGRPGVVNEYSKAPPWNADGSRFLLMSTDGYRLLHDGRTYGFLRALPLPVGDIEPRWSASDPDRLYYTLGNVLCEFRFPDEAAQVVARFDADMVTGGREQDLLSLPDGRLAFALLLRDEDAGGEAEAMRLSVLTWREGADGAEEVTWTAPRLVYDRATRGDLRPDAIALTPRWVAMSWSEPYVSDEPTPPIETVREESGRGMSLYRWDGTLERKLFRGTHEWDVCRDRGGRDVVVTYGSNDNDPRDTREGGNKLVMLGLDEPTRTVLFTNDWLLSGHVSCRGPPGWAFVGSVDETNAAADVAPENRALVDRILAVALDAQAPRRVVLAETGTQVFDSTGADVYWHEVHLVPDRAGARVVWASNFGVRVDDAEYADVVVAEVALPREPFS